MRTSASGDFGFGLAILPSRSPRHPVHWPSGSATDRARRRRCGREWLRAPTPGQTRSSSMCAVILLEERRQPPLRRLLAQAASRNGGRQVSFGCIGADRRSREWTRSPTLETRYILAERRNNADRLDAGNGFGWKRVEAHTLIDVDEVDADCGSPEPELGPRRRSQSEACRCSSCSIASWCLQLDDLGHDASLAAGRKKQTMGSTQILRNCSKLKLSCDILHNARLVRPASFPGSGARGKPVGGGKGLGVDYVTVACRVAAPAASGLLKLVDRRPRSYVLTEDGKGIAAIGAQMEEIAFAVERAGNGQRSRTSTGRSSIGAPPSLARQYPDCSSADAVAQGSIQASSSS